MSPRSARTLRAALGFPRIPKTMDAVQRHAYRSVKARFVKLPAPARAMFLANLNLLRGTVAAI